MKKITLSSETILEIIKQYQSGLSLKKVGKQFFVSGDMSANYCTRITFM
jgi:hypothetical protein